MIKGYLSPSVTKLEQDNRKLALKAAIEGIVLLENKDDCLPLKERRIALFGAGAKHATKGGTGSGEVNNRDNVSIYDAFISLGYEITSTRWLNDYEQYRKIARKQFITQCKEAIKKQSLRDENACYWAVDPIKEGFPVGRKINEQDFKETQTNTAIYVITRQAGEGRDRLFNEGDYFLTEVEKDNIAFIAKHYQNSVLVINAGASCDLSFLSSLPLKAVVFMAQAGEEGGNALAHLLTGKKNFSGKLSATWYENLKDHPLSTSFSSLGGQTDYEEYKEGIYVGYRYIDAFKARARYPFGFGLSYTKFNFVGKAALKGSTVEIQAKVKNVGEKDGAEILQAYLHFPRGKAKREVKALTSFARTKELSPNEETTITLAFDLQDWGYYDEKTSSYILEKGLYLVSLGESSLSPTPILGIKVETDIVTEISTPICPLHKDFKELESPSVDPVSYEGTIVILEPESIKTITHSYGKKEEISPLVLKMNDDELAHLVSGLEGFNDNEAPRVPPGCAGKTNPYPSTKYGIPILAMADGPAGLRLIPEFRSDGKNKAKGFMTSEKLALASRYYAIKLNLRRLSLKKKHYQYATAFPVGILLAQTFDQSLLEDIGRAVSREMDAFAIDIWLAPGMNIMRFPLCGRNFEYFSEDPLLNGKMAAAISRGVASSNHHTVTFKHFACNNQEDNRMKNDSLVKERALREIYLKGFKIAIKEGHSDCVMTSYNKINGVYTNSSYDLVTKILRDEWGFGGFVMTDWGSVAPTQAVGYESIKAGNDIIMTGGENEAKNLLIALKEGKLTKEEIACCASRITKVALKLGKKE